MQKIAKFSKVSCQRFVADYMDCFGCDQNVAQKVYDGIKLPQRATTGSAGYDFYSTAQIELKAGQGAKIPTGIRVQIDDGWLLAVFPRSGLGFKYRLQLDNTVGIIDSDYFYSDNEGHIFIKITNDSKQDKVVSLSEGMAFAQGIFLPFGVTVDDDVTATRNGGFGSTDKNK